MLFGLTQSNHFDRYDNDPLLYAFRVKVSASGEISTKDGDFNRVEVDTGGDIFGDRYDFIMGMKPEMVIEGSEYFIHCILASPGKKQIVYLKISTDDDTSKVLANVH